MKVVVIKAFTYKGVREVLGQKMVVADELGRQWIEANLVREYHGDMNQKIRTDFFKPK